MKFGIAFDCSHQVFLQGLSEQSARVAGLLDSGRGLLDKYSTALDTLKEHIAKLSAHRGEAVLSVESLDKETAPGVANLQTKLNDFQSLWDALNSLLQSRSASIEATLTASKDMSEAVGALTHEVKEVGQLTASLKPLSAERLELSQQMDDLKVRNFTK